MGVDRVVREERGEEESEETKTTGGDLCLLYKKPSKEKKSFCYKLSSTNGSLCLSRAQKRIGYGDRTASGIDRTLVQMYSFFTMLLLPSSKTGGGGYDIQFEEGGKMVEEAFLYSLSSLFIVLLIPLSLYPSKCIVVAQTCILISHSQYSPQFDLLFSNNSFPGIYISLPCFCNCIAATVLTSFSTPC